MRPIGYIYLTTALDALSFQEETKLELPADDEHLVFAHDDRPESVTVQKYDILQDDKPEYICAPARLVLNSPYFIHL